MLVEINGFDIWTLLQILDVCPHWEQKHFCSLHHRLQKVVNNMNNRNNCKLTTLLGLFYPCWRISSSTEFAKRNKRMMSLKTIIIIIMQSDVLSSIDIQSWWCKMLLLVLMTHVSLQFGWSCSFEQIKYIVLATVTYS